MKKEKRDRVLALRALGKSYSEIQKETGASKSYINYWATQVKLTKDQIENLVKKNPLLNGSRKGMEVASEHRRKERENWREEGRKIARVNKDPEFVAGIALYWAEGAKSNNRNSVKLCNTDGILLKYFLNFLRKYFNVQNNKIKFKVDCYPTTAMPLEKIQKHWLTFLNLDSSCLTKATTIHRKTTGKKKNIHTYGVGGLVIHSTETMQKIYGAIQELFGASHKNWGI